MDDFELFNVLLRKMQTPPPIKDRYEYRNCECVSSLAETGFGTICTGCGIQKEELFPTTPTYGLTYPRPMKIFKLNLPSYLNGMAQDQVIDNYLTLTNGVQYRGRFRRAIVAYVIYNYYDAIYDLEYIISSLMQL
jgi:hypothetical protein